MKDEKERKAIEGMINNLGQTPCQLLKVRMRKRGRLLRGSTTLVRGHITDTVQLTDCKIDTYNQTFVVYSLIMHCTHILNTKSDK